MKAFVAIIAAAFLAASFTMPADAASKKKDTAMAAKQKSCKEQAKKKFSAMHPLKRRGFEKKCMGQA